MYYVIVDFSKKYCYSVDILNLFFILDIDLMVYR